ncbi:MAG: urea ABC transporter permease subunit UrtB [Aeromonadaceae bacterium]
MMPRLLVSPHKKDVMMPKSAHLYCLSKRIQLGFGSLLALLFTLWSAQLQAMTEPEALAVLTGKDFSAKEAAILTLAQSHQPYVAPLLRALQQGDLFYRKSDKQLVIRQGQSFVSAIDNQSLSGSSHEFKRVGLNNALRDQLARLAANLALDAPEPAQRLAAVKSLLGQASPEQVAELQARQAKEPDAGVKRAYGEVLALLASQSSNSEARLQAIPQLAEARNPQILARLKQLATSDPDAKVQQQASLALKGIERSQRFFAGVETLYFGISLGSVLVLAGIGLAITFGVMGVINMAHGELMMLGAYTTFVLQKWLPGQPGLALLLSIPAAFLVSGAVGILIERGVIRFLYGRPLETLLATFGISLLLQQAVRSIFSPLNQSVVMPSWMSGTWVINDFLSLTLNRLVIIFFTLLLFAGLMWLLKRSRLGLEVRAVSQNRAMARNMGVRSARVNALTFGLGSGIAGIAGVALSQLTNVGPNLGQGYIIDAFMVVVFGGVGNLWGTLVAGLTLGVANKLLEPVAGAMLAKILILIAIILFIQKRPRGLFPQRGRAVEG